MRDRLIHWWTSRSGPRGARSIRRALWLQSALIAGLAGGLAACDDGGGQTALDIPDGGATGGNGGGAAGAGGEEGCVSDLEFFQREVSLPLLETDCLSCHNPQGAARNSMMVLLSPSEANYLSENMNTLREVAAYERDGTSILLLKPTGQVDHGGGVRIDAEGAQYAALEGLLDRFENPVECATQMDDRGLLDRVRLLDLPSTLRQAQLQLTGTLPGADALDQVTVEGEEALRDIVAGLLEDDAFYDQLMRWYNDHLLTDKYLPGESALDLLDGDRFPRKYYNELPEESEARTLGRRYTNVGVARAPLELIAHVVRNDLPFTEILTADYMVANPYVAQAYGIDDIDFDDMADPEEWRVGHIPDMAHAGLLTDPMFLNRFPTTETNLNRHRSRMVWLFFLATDILKKAERPVDPTQFEGHNPTMNDPQCAVCHEQVDPLAGVFRNWDGRARLVEDAEWPESLRPPGFGDDVLPPAEYPRALQWAAERIVADERFAIAAVQVVYQGLIGRPPMANPTDPNAPGFDAQLAFYNLEQAFLRTLAERFVASGHQLKTIIPDIVVSPFYRAQGSDDLTEDEMSVLDPLGATRLLTPEELHQRIIAVTGYPWKRRVGDRDLLLDGREMAYFYGGIDSDNITRRISEPNGIMANIGLRMASEMGCLLSPREFTKLAADRDLLPYVERTFTPEDDNGFAIDGAQQAIRENIRYLHYRILGEVLDLDHPEIDATFELFMSVWREGRVGVAQGLMPRDLPSHCHANGDFYTEEPVPEEMRVFRDDNYVVRSWAAVITYLLADWRFLYQ
ncbi:MAG: hypothetical protein ACE366_20865 [Bradymonadia bacterium]